jgi:hypothetical protein
MRRIARLAAMMLVWAAPLVAQSGEVCHHVPIVKDFCRRNCWPQPFSCAERPTVRAPFAIQVANGWERQNLMGDWYFDAETGQLNEAGKLKIQWVVFDCPEQHRAIFVRHTANHEQTDARLTMVRDYAAQIAPNGDVPQVMPSMMSDQGRSADWIDRVNRKYITSAPEPKLPAASEGSGSGSGSGS